MSLIYTGVMENKNAEIELLREGKNKSQNEVVNLKNKAQDDSLKMFDLSENLKVLELTRVQSRQKIILSDTTLCPREGLRIFDGNVIVSYKDYVSTHQVVVLDIFGDDKLKIDYGSMSLSFKSPEQRIFSVNDKEYLLNYLGFVKDKNEGCIKISILKK